jgi:hypothetical protein
MVLTLSRFYLLSLVCSRAISLPLISIFVLHFYPEDGSISVTFLRNAIKLLSDYMASHPRRQKSSQSQLLERLKFLIMSDTSTRNWDSPLMAFSVKHSVMRSSIIHSSQRKYTLGKHETSLSFLLNYSESSNWEPTATSHIHL